MPEQLPQSLAKSLADLLGHAEYQRLVELGREAPPETIELVCPRCKGAGWLRLDLPAGAHDFGRIVECQCGIVAGRRTETAMGASQIPVEYADLGLDTYPNQKTAQELDHWWKNPTTPWLMLVGDRGVGKTGLTIGLVKASVSRGSSAVFRPAPDLLSEIRATYSTRDASSPSEAKLVGALKGAEVLAVDDLGAARWTSWAQERLYEIVNHRYNERRRTIWTIDLAPDQMEELLGERIWARMLGMSWVYEITGPNLRKAS